MKDDTIASAARRWDSARLEAIALRKRRGEFICAREAASAALNPEHGPPIGYRSSVPPCWKTFVDTSSRYGEEQSSGRMPEDRWCELCRARQMVYLALRDATRRRGAALRAMMTLLATERKRLGFTDSYERRA